MENQRLKCVVIDDDPDVFDDIKGFLMNSDKAVITHCFLRCTDFLREMKDISFDLVFLDCLFPNDTKMGVDVAIALKEIDKSFIFISAKDSSFVEACRIVGALDAMPKPLTERRLNESVSNAYKILMTSHALSDRHALIHVKDQKGKINIRLSNILYARPDRQDPRNKLVRLRDNINHIFMEYNFYDLLALYPRFQMANKSEMVNLDIVKGESGEYVILSQLENNKIPKSIPLSPIFKEKFNLGFH